MEVAPRYWQSPDTLRDIYVSTSGGAASGTQGTNALTGTVARRGGPTTTAAQIANDVVRNENTNRLANTGRGGASTGAAVSTSQEIMIPLAAFAQFAPGSAPLAVNHQGQFLAATISFNLASGVSLSDATAAIDRTMNELHVPVTIHGTFQGTAGAFQKSLDNQPILILAALIAVYVVLGILYESYIHPITILSTLPSAGVGAVLALMAFRTEFSIMALIGVILLIGIVKKNAIIMIDFAIDAERQRKLSPREAIAEACHLRFRPIMMTTMAALFGAVPLAVGIGEGSEMRQPLGIAIVGGLIVSQMLTLYTTPVIYLYFDRFRLWAQGLWRRLYHRDRGALAPGAGE
jgi:multidrug efflux pump